MNKYLDHLEKKAALGEVALLHLGQNVAINGALRMKSFARGVSKTIGMGIKNVARPKSNFLKSMASGATVPEISAIHNEAYHLGQNLSPVLQGLSKKDAIGVRMMTQGRFADLKKYGLHRSAGVIRVAKHIEENHGVPVHSLLSLADHPKADKIFHEVGQVWNDKSHPLLSNIMAHSTKNLTAGLKGTTTSSLGGRVHSGMGLGAAAMTAADPITGAINAAKVAVTSPKVAQNKYVGGVIKKVNEKLFVDPTKSSFGKGMAGQKENPVKVAIKKNVVNPIAGHLSGTSNALGLAVNRGMQ